jgi:hypothetical protein
MLASMPEVIALTPQQMVSVPNDSPRGRASLGRIERFRTAEILSTLVGDLSLIDTATAEDLSDDDDFAQNTEKHNFKKLTANSNCLDQKKQEDGDDDDNEDAASSGHLTSDGREQQPGLCAEDDNHKRGDKLSIPDELLVAPVEQQVEESPDKSQILFQSARSEESSVAGPTNTTKAPEASLQTTSSNHFPRPHLCELVHPSCIGFVLAQKDLCKVAMSATLVSPSFFGASFTPGHRHDGIANVQKRRKKNAPKALTLDNAFASNKLVLKPRTCWICFGETHRCPRCWASEHDENEIRQVSQSTIDALIGRNAGEGLGRRHGKPLIMQPQEWDLSKVRRCPNKYAPTPKPKTGPGLPALPVSPSKARRRSALVAAAEIARKRRVDLTKAAQKAMDAQGPKEKLLNTPAAITKYRIQTARICTVYVKKLPQGPIVRFSLETNRPIMYLYFLYRTVAPIPVSQNPHTQLVLPTSIGLFNLDPTVSLVGDRTLGTSMGKLTLEDFGIRGRGQSVSLFHVANLNQPHVGDMVANYVTQNLSLVEETINTDCAVGGVGPGKGRPKLKQMGLEARVDYSSFAVANEGHMDHGE